MNEDEIVVVFCNPADAKMLLDQDESVSDALVISPIIPEGEVTVVPKDEFLEWLRNE